MSRADSAMDLGARHPEASVVLGADVLLAGRLPEAGPARSGVELGVRVKEQGTAAGALVDPSVLVIPVFPGKGWFGSLLAGHVVLLGSERPPPFFVALGYFGIVFTGWL